MTAVRRGWFGAPSSRRGPEVKPGHEKRPLRQLHGEKIEEAMVRAAALSWWPRAIEKRPIWSAGHWVWTLRAERAR